MVITITEDWSRKEIFILLTINPRLPMTQYRKISKNMAGKLTAKEAYLFYCLALKSDYITNESNIEQETLAKEYGIEDTDQISDWLYKFQSCGLLIVIKTNIKGQYGRFQKNRYLLNTENYVFISEVLKDEPISRQLKGFLILLKCKCLSGTNTTLYSQNKLAKELGISVGTISNYIKEAIDNGYISKDKKGIQLLREDIFLKTKTSFPIIKNKKSTELIDIVVD